MKYIKKYYKETGTYTITKKNFYLYGRQIGYRAFGKVNIASHIERRHFVAIKTFNKKNLKRKNAKQKIKNEIGMLNQLRHPFINQILDSFEMDIYIFIVMEYICGDLLSFIKKEGNCLKLYQKLYLSNQLKD